MFVCCSKEVGGSRYAMVNVKQGGGSSFADSMKQLIFADLPGV